MEVQIPDLFDLQKIADSGQCFRAVGFSDGTYRFFTGTQALYIRNIAGDCYEISCSPGVWEQVWVPYFDLGRDYRALNRLIPEEDCFLRQAAQAGAGIRILRQDPWETLMTFLISQRKSIPAIREVVELLSRRYGTPCQTPRETLCTFPTAAQLQGVTVQDYAACKAGYRAPYLYDAVQQVLFRRLDLAALSALPDDALISALEGVRGVGIKVASCVALYAYGRGGCAPVDTWIQKVIRQKYHGENPFPAYGGAAGIMQQYCFYYAQQHRQEVS